MLAEKGQHGIGAGGKLMSRLWSKVLAMGIPILDGFNIFYW